MSQIEIGLDPELPKDLAPALRQHLQERWPELAFTPLRLPATRRDARDGPLLVLLRPGSELPPGDPGELAAVAWDPAANAAGRGPLFLQIDAEIARVTAGRRGRPPERDVSPPPREMTRRALLQIPLPLGRPLPPVPWFEAEICLQAKGCDKCAAACPEAAIKLSGAAAAIDVERCTSCGACVAECPTGALESPYLGDGQWQAALQVLSGAADGPALTLRCPWTPRDVPVGDVSLPVGCVGEVGWHHLLTCLGETGRLPELTCPKSDCPMRGQAEAAIERLELLSTALVAKPEDSPSAEVPDVATAPRRSKIAAAMRRLEPALAERAKLDTWPGLGWAPQLEGACTLCGACVNACPTTACWIEEAADFTALQVDPGLCTGCGACSRICPEHVLGISRASVGDLLGPREVFRAKKAVCQGCGLPYESPTFVAALRRRMLEAGFTGVLVDRLDYCPECRAALQRG